MKCIISVSGMVTIMTGGMIEVPQEAEGGMGRRGHRVVMVIVYHVIGNQPSFFIVAYVLELIRNGAYASKISYNTE